jgi:PAS domain S-box-containing protein
MMHQIGVEMLGVYDWRLVVLSYSIAVVASYTALDLARRVALVRGRARIAWLVGGAFAMGTGIWSMHFTGMLAFSLPVALTYDVPMVLFSLLVAMLASGFALFVAGRRTLSLAILLASGLPMGLGIAAMHYIGMAALRMPVTISYDPVLFGLSILIAVGASAAALWLAFHLRSGRMAPRMWLGLKIGSALVMGVAITGMHYTGMLAAHFTPEAGAMPSAVAGSDTLPLGAAIGLATLIVLGLALISSLVDQRFSTRSAELDSLFRYNLDAVFAFDLAGKLQSANPAAERITGYQIDELRRVPLQSLVVVEDYQRCVEAFKQAIQGRSQSYDMALTDRRGWHIALSASCIPIMVGDKIAGVYLIAKNMTERQRAETQLRASEERYRTMLAELSTPLIPITREVVIMPLVGGLDERRIQQMQTTLLHSLADLRARWVILDLTGVPLIDTQVAESLIRSAQAVRLLGAQVMLTGIRAPLAQTLVHLNVDFRSIVTLNSLQEGITYALGQVGAPEHALRVR